MQTHSLRRGLAAAALSTLAATGVAAPALAATGSTAPVSVDCADPAPAVADAKAAVVAARQVFHDTNKPLGQLIAQERTDARTEARSARATLKQNHQALRNQDLSAGGRKDLVAQNRQARHDLRHSTRLLESKRAVLAQIKADRKTARQAWADARANLRAVKQAAAACDTSADTGSDG